ncbi:MAG TPA: hypothetical protein VNA25_05700 [Phycisphaerae bacterium]|nr:hypothetical protein [Phycisphaerae bacterium]HUT57351.1 hypothetical protein [Phycisphaerae bacterium]
MYLSDVDLREAIRSGRLIVDPPPTDELGATSIDLHLDGVDQARVWDTGKLAKHNKAHGRPTLELDIARMTYGLISRKYLIAPPHEREAKEESVIRRDDSVIIKPMGFVLWQTKEVIGTPEESPRYICFVNGKSTRSRTGLIVHLTAPTVHAGWNGNVTLEMTNCGPLDLVLHEGDAVAQLTVAMITCPPSLDVRLHESATHGQSSVAGAEPGPT